MLCEDLLHRQSRTRKWCFCLMRRLWNAATVPQRPLLQRPEPSLRQVSPALTNHTHPTRINNDLGCSVFIFIKVVTSKILPIYILCIYIYIYIFLFGGSPALKLLTKQRQPPRANVSLEEWFSQIYLEQKMQSYPQLINHLGPPRFQIYALEKNDPIVLHDSGLSSHQIP